MKMTRWTFAAVVAILLVSVTRPGTHRAAGATHDETRSLDFTGIERLHVESGDLDIVIGGAPSLSVIPFDAKVEVERRGDALHIRTPGGDADYYGGTLVVPVRLGEIQLRGQIDIEAESRVESLRITTDHPFAWEGDARRLEIVRVPRGADEAADDGDCDCGGIIDVDGVIDDLVVRTHTGKVYVDRAGGHGHVTLDLAEGVTFDLENAVDLAGVDIIRRPAVSLPEKPDPAKAAEAPAAVTDDDAKSATP